MKRFLLTIVLANLVAILLAGDLVLFNVKAKDGIRHLTRLDNLTVNYLGNGFVIGTKTGDLQEEFTLIEPNAWQPGSNYFLVFVNRSKNQTYLNGVKSYSEIVYQTDDLTVIKVNDEKLKEVEPPVDGSLAKVVNEKVKLPVSKLNIESIKSEPDPFIVDRLAEVNTTLMQSNLQNLQNYGTRNAYNAQSIVAQNWIKAQFESYGLSTQLFDFTMPGGSASDNVIATKTGTLYPNEYVIIGGHYDSYTGSSSAPGADDNASGTCGVLEIARILSPYSYDRTIIFCAFSGEEYGLYGSAAYATWCDNQNLNILGYLNMDMIGYLKAGDPIHTDIIAPASAQELVDYYTTICALYLPDFITGPGSLSGGDSDHTSFNNHGFMGIFPFEDSQYYSPYIHTTSDVIGTSVNNFTQVGMFTKAILATTVSLANMVHVDIDVNPLNFEVTLAPDASVDQEMFISNYGDPDLNFIISKQYIENDKAPLAYCTASGGCDEYISSITFNTLTNNSGTCSSGGYADYTALSTTVDAGNTYNFSYTIGTYYTSDDVGVWIDWNQNQVFTDAGENVICVSNCPASSTYSITVPADAPSGTTRMRVRIKYTGADCGSSCGTASYGEVEDYTIIVNNSPYTWLTVSPITGTVTSQGTTPVNLNFNSEGLEEGDYYANVKINSNDPDEPLITIPCTLHVASHIILDISAMLEGPYSASGMQTDLNVSGLLPFSQPFNIAPWNYTGSESVAAIPNENVVDWVLVELRDAASAATATSATRIDQQAAFILNDGSVVGMDGASLLQFDNSVTQELFVIIYHRNHLGVLSGNALTQAGGIYSYNFINPSGQAFGGINALNEVSEGMWSLISGDGDGNGIIDENDKILDWQIDAGTSNYLQGDYNLDGQVNNPDKDEFWVPNLGAQSAIPD